MTSRRNAPLSATRAVVLALAIAACSNTHRGRPESFHASCPDGVWLEWHDTPLSAACTQGPRTVHGFTITYDPSEGFTVECHPKPESLDAPPIIDLGFDGWWRLAGTRAEVARDAVRRSCAGKSFMALWSEFVRLDAESPSGRTDVP